MSNSQITYQVGDDEDKRRKHREAQRRYIEKQKMGWEAAFEYQNTITMLQTQLTEKNTQALLLQQLVNTTESGRLQLQNQLNESSSTITNLNRDLQEKNNTISQLQLSNSQLQSRISQLESTVSQLDVQTNEQNVTSVSHLQDQLSFKDSTISQLESRNSLLQQQILSKDTSLNDSERIIIEKDHLISQLQSQVEHFDSSVSTLRNQLTEKDASISQLQSRLNGCVSTDVDRRLQDLSQSLANEMERQKSCLQTINQLNSENANLKVFRDLAIELNNKFPKILTSFVNELQQPGNQASSPELKAWASDQISKISPTLILSLAAFKNPTPTQVPLQPNVSVRSPSPIMVPTTKQPVATQPITQPIIQPLISTQPLISSQNVPFVSLLPNTSVSNIPQSRSSMNTPIFNHPASNDPDFHRWLYLYQNNLKDGNEFINLYQVLRRRYNMTPVQITKQYNLR